MNFEMSTEQEILRKTVRQFVDEEIIPYIAKWDAEGGFDAKIWSRLAELGLMGVCVPEQYGGSGMDYNALAIVCEELERGDTAFRTAVSVHTGLNSMTLMQWGRKSKSSDTLFRKLKVFGLEHLVSQNRALGLM